MDRPAFRVVQPDDQGALETFLVSRLDTSMFLLGNLRSAGLVDHGQRYEGTYAAAFVGEAIVGVVAQYWNGNLILQAPRELPALVRAAVGAAGRPVRGLLGPAAQVQVAKTTLGINAPHCQLDDTEHLYTLRLDDLVVPDGLRSGRLHGRRLVAGDLDLVAAWRAAYTVETLGAVDSPQLRAEARAEMEQTLREGRSWLLEAEGRPVASTSFNAVIAEAVQVGGVWTPPPLRGRGYARAVVAASLLDARAAGHQRAILFTGEANVPAQRAYAALGFQRSGDYSVVLLREPFMVTA